MWSQINIISNKDLPSDLEKKLEKFFGAPLNNRKALKETVNKDATYLLDYIVYSKKNNREVFIILKEDKRRLSIHLESNIKKDNLRLIQESLQKIFKDTKRFMKSNGYSIKESNVTIWAEDEQIMQGVYFNFARHFKTFISKDIPTKAYIPFATLILSYATGSDFKESFANLGIVIVATLLWIIAKSIFSHNSLKFEAI